MLVLQERDRKLLDALQAMRVINREQAKAVGGFRSTRRTNDRLLALTRAGFLKRAFIGSREAVYWAPGKPLQERGRTRADAIAEPAAIFLRHQLEINRVQLLVQHGSIPIPSWRFVGWQRFQKPLSPTIPLIPDGYFELASVQELRSIFVEVDLGTEPAAVLTKKATFYLQMAVSGEFSAIFHSGQFRVLVITISERRRENLRQAIARVTAKIFWLGTLSLLEPEKFWSDSWLRPSGDQLQSFL
jgi:hypothetical protein